MTRGKMTVRLFDVIREDGKWIVGTTSFPETAQEIQKKFNFYKTIKIYNFEVFFGLLLYTILSFQLHFF